MGTSNVLALMLFSSTAHAYDGSFVSVLVSEVKLKLSINVMILVPLTDIQKLDIFLTTVPVKDMRDFVACLLDMHGTERVLKCLCFFKIAFFLVKGVIFQILVTLKKSNEN